MRKSSSIVFVAAAVLASTSALAGGTHKSWDGSQFVYEFGCPNTTTYGQVITVPNNKHSLNSFTFWWANSVPGSMVVRGEIYAWDGSKATGSALYESDPRTISLNGTKFHKEVFASVATVTPGAQYVVFASIDKDYEQCSNATLEWGAVDDSVYGGGTFVYQNNSGDESQWTSSAWSTFGIDLAFNMAFGP